MPNTNPYQSDKVPQGSRRGLADQWPIIVTAFISAYYFLSAITLPIANKVWFGEAPLLSILQIPKSFLKAIAQRLLLSGMDKMGWSFGSASPDYGATHPWAMGVMVALPAIIVTSLLAFNRPSKWRLCIAAILILSLLDGAVTIWIETTSQLKHYNASFW